MGKKVNEVAVASAAKAASLVRYYLRAKGTTKGSLKVPAERKRRRIRGSSFHLFAYHLSRDLFHGKPRARGAANRY